MAQQAKYDYLIKLLLIGDSSVGKSSCLTRFTEDSFSPSFITTIGIDFKIRTIPIANKTAKLQIWDTAGQERFQSITVAYYRGAMGIFIVYDVTCKTSFDNVRKWSKDVEAHGTPGVKKFLLGNKCESDESKRVVSYQEGESLANELGIPFLEVSAKNNVNIDKAFTDLATSIKEDMDKADPKDTDPIASGDFSKESNNSCC